MDMKVLRYGILAGFVGSRFGSHSSVVGFDHIYLGKPIKQNYTFMHFQIYLLALPKHLCAFSQPNLSALEYLICRKGPPLSQLFGSNLYFY